jgi:OmcA/MtrC family decaheme c-type cytochrome
MTKKASYQIATVAFLLVVLVGLSAATINQLGFSKFDKRAYLTDEQVAFIRPGLVLTVQDVNVATDGTVAVTYQITDPKGLPLDRDGVFTPGPVSTSFILAHIPKDETQYVAYTTRKATSPITNVTTYQAGTDSGGSTVKLSDGVYTYTFKTKLPAGDDPTETHTVGMYFTRDLSEFDLGSEYANEVVDFLPSGGPVTKVRDVVRTVACNKCHDPLSAHGGSRRAVELCILCHTPQTIDPDTGESMDMPVLVHKIHMGSSLPSVEAGTPYIVIGHNQSVVDFSDVVFPQDIRNCETCHDPASGAIQEEAYLLRPNRAACGACHDNVNFATGANHPGLAQISDRFCANCHYPEGELEFDASIKGAHTIPFKSTQLKGLNIELIEITNTMPGQNPIVRYRVKDNAGNLIAPNTLRAISLVIGGPTTDYTTLIRESGPLTDSVASGDAYIYNFTGAIPADAQGTFVLSAEASRNVTLNPGTTQEIVQRETAPNPILYFAVTGEVTPRRTVVTTEACDVCHDVLMAHGGNRRNVEYCVVCHYPAAQDADQRPADQLPSRSIDFKFMVHRIHTGEELTRLYTIYGHGESPVTFNDVLYPGDRRDCAKCHSDETFSVPSPGVEETVDAREFYSPIPPNSAACLGCHDELDAAAHTYNNTAPFGEACGACHDADAAFAVTKVHAR